MFAPSVRVRWSAILGLAAALIVSTRGAAAAAPQLKITKIVTLEGELASALDVRWIDEAQVALAAGKEGVFSLDIVKGRHDLLIPGASRRGFFFSMRLGRSQRYTVTAAHFAALLWRRNDPKSPLSEPAQFDAITDIDVYADTLAVLGARRDAKGRFASEGAIAWIGSLGSGLSDLRPLHYSESGPGARALNRCPFLTGAIRFLRDGSILVVPAFETGMFLYDRSGKLLQTWSTSELGFQDRCTLSDEQVETLSAGPTARWQWFNERAILDDIVPLPEGIGMIVRRMVNGRREWTFMVVRDGKVTTRLPIAITANERSQIRADVRGNRLALLVIEFATSKSPERARLALAQLAQ